MAAWPGNTATTNQWHWHGCNCGTGSPGCLNAQGTATTFVVYSNVASSMDSELDAFKDELKSAKVRFFPAIADDRRRDPPPESADVCRWREWARAKRHSRHDRAPPVMAA